MIDEIVSILKAQFIVILIIISSYIIESLTTFKLLIWNFKWKKNNKLATGAADINAILYFIICLGVFLYDKYIAESISEHYSFIDWLILIIPLTIIVRKLYFKYTVKDPDRGDFDFSD